MTRLFVILFLSLATQLSPPVQKLARASQTPNPFVDTPSYEKCTGSIDVMYERNKVRRDVNSAYAIAYHYLYGVCVQQNIVRGISLMEFAAANNHVEAAFELGEIYYVGELVEANIRKSRHYFLRAADAGYLKAQHEYGVIMLKHAESEFDRHKALYWLGMAANQNDGFTAYLLGMIHQTGLHGVDRNPCLALDWYESAQMMGFGDSAGLYAKLHEKYQPVCN